MPANAMPDLGAPFILSYDSDDTAYPVVAIQFDSQIGPGQVPTPTLGSAPPSAAGGGQFACPGTTFPNGFIFAGATTLVAERRMQWTFRKLPGPWVTKGDTRDDGAVILTKTRFNIGANITVGDVVTNGQNVVTSEEPVDDYISKEIQTSVITPGPTGWTVNSYSERGDAITQAITYVDPGSTPPADTFGNDVDRQPLTIHQAKQTVTVTPVYGWLYGSQIDPETTIVGQIAKTFVANSHTNTAAVLIGPQTVNGKVFGATGDLVVVEYQDRDDKMQTLIVTVFAIAQVEGVTLTMPFFGSYPIPPQLVTATFLQDPATSTSVGSGTANWSDEVSVDWDGELGLTFGYYPEKFAAVRTRKFFIGPPSGGQLPTPTFIVPAFGQIVIKGGSYHIAQSSWANDTAAGNSQSIGTSTRYKFRDLPPCLWPYSGNLSSAGSVTPSGSGTSLGVTGVAAISGYIQASTPHIFNSGDTITEYATEKGRYSIYVLDKNVYAIP